MKYEVKYDLSFLEVDLRELLKKLKKHNTYASQLENEIILYKLEIERLNKIIEDIKKFIKGYDMDLLTYGELEMLRSIELIINGIVEVK